MTRFAHLRTGRQRVGGAPELHEGVQLLWAQLLRTSERSQCHLNTQSGFPKRRHNRLHPAAFRTLVAWKSRFQHAHLLSRKSKTFSLFLTRHIQTGLEVTLRNSKRCGTTFFPFKTFFFFFKVHDFFFFFFLITKAKPHFLVFGDHGVWFLRANI